MVRITVDTEKDSAEAIRRAIRFLQSCLDDSHMPVEPTRREIPDMNPSPSADDLLSGADTSEDEEDNNFFSLMEF